MRILESVCLEEERKLKVKVIIAKFLFCIYVNRQPSTTAKNMNSSSSLTTRRLDIKLPSGLPQLLEILARECIRKQPENIYTFLADLVQDLLLG